MTFVTSSCATGIIGEDIDSVVEDVKAQKLSDSVGNSGYFSPNIFPCTSINEKDVVFGGIKKLHSTIENALKVIDTIIEQYLQKADKRQKGLVKHQIRFLATMVDWKISIKFQRQSLIYLCHLGYQ